ncbi:TetR family transcriptional regulator [Tersicoccus solisilvae]|uniref:TetR family transcriptional regulator n=1 Tax=Tersicoccus solisilvae TaxID=1882339 RepID=A0ABQ1PKM5_9MICC|nr:TetR/AcrR family transcriptional regulator [Tersicoccus solisilvae]GGC98617.1 TetR family transcriptional regulator [Tersicoccus solisilvae]
MSAPTGASGPREPVRRPARTARTRAKLFDAAITLLGERGPAHVSIDEIAAAAGVSKGTVYYNFSSKADLVAKVLESGVDLMEERLRSIPDGSDPVDRVADMVGRALEFLAEYPSFTRLWMSEMWRPASQWQTELSALRDRLLSLIREGLQAVARVHDVDPAVPVEQLAVTLMGSTMFAGLSRDNHGPALERDTAVAVVMTAVRGWVRD